MKIERSCPICDTIYFVSQKALQKGKETTCSRVCSYKYRARKLRQSSKPHSRFPSERTCPTCKRVFESVHAKYCSRACRPTSPQRRVQLCCERCGKVYEVQAHRADSSKYCSKDCMFPKNYVTCQNCQQVYHTPPSATTERNYCSVECMAEHWTGVERLDLRTRIQISCTVCGQDFERQPNQIALVEHSYCSRACFAIGHRKRMSGEKNPAWRGGLTLIMGLIGSKSVCKLYIVIVTSVKSAKLLITYTFIILHHYGYLIAILSAQMP